MSVRDHVLVWGELTMARLADEVASIHPGERSHPEGLGHDPYGIVWLDHPGSSRAVSVFVRHNTHAVESPSPGEASIYDDADYLVDVRVGAGGDGPQLRMARAVFEALQERHSWRLALVHDFDTLVATWDPEHGLRKYPEQSSSDVHYQDLPGRP